MVLLAAAGAPGARSLRKVGEREPLPPRELGKLQAVCPVLRCKRIYISTYARTAQALLHKHVGMRYNFGLLRGLRLAPRRALHFHLRYKNSAPYTFGFIKHGSAFSTLMRSDSDSNQVWDLRSFKIMYLISGLLPKSQEFV